MWVGAAFGSSVTWQEYVSSSTRVASVKVSSVHRGSTGGGDGCPVGGAAASAGTTGAAPTGSARLSQSSFQKIRHPAWQPPWALPSQRTPSRCTVRSMRYMPLCLTWPRRS